MTPAARWQAAIEVLDEVLAGRPLEQALTRWARRSRFAGSKDRAAVRDHVFDAVRCRRSFAALGGSETGRGLVLGAVRHLGQDPDSVFTGDRHAPAVLGDAERKGGRPPATDPERLDLPDWLWPQFRDSLGDDAAETARYLQNRGPVCLRVNLARTGVENALQALAGDGVEAVLHPRVPGALLVQSGQRRIATGSAYRDGLVELQDASSQDVVAAIPLRPGMRVLDYCAGGGGKALALAMTDGVEVFAHDVSAARLGDLPARAARAGVDVTILTGDQLEGAGPFDVVLVDAPCSGSGSWRRAPMGKWELTPDRLARLQATQSEILSEAERLLTADGRLVYATCSVLKSENEEVIQAFMRRSSRWCAAFEHRWPVTEDGDGFYSSHLTRAELTV